MASRIPPSATKDNYLKLKERHDLDLAVGVARDYLDAAIAQPRGTVVTHWSISCLPSTGGGGRLFTVNVGALEGAYLRVLQEYSVVTGYVVTVFVDRATLEHDCAGSLAELDHRFGDDVLLEIAEAHQVSGACRQPDQRGPRPPHRSSRGSAVETRGSVPRRAADDRKHLRLCAVPQPVASRPRPPRLRTLPIGGGRRRCEKTDTEQGEDRGNEDGADMDGAWRSREHTSVARSAPIYTSVNVHLLAEAARAVAAAADHPDAGTQVQTSLRRDAPVVVDDAGGAIGLGNRGGHP